MKEIETQFIDIDDARIAYCEHGSGETLILLHGNSESKRIFSKYQTDHFRMFRTIAVDSRGHGETVSNDARLSIDRYSEDVIRLCAAKGIAKASVIGYSDGGTIGLLLAKKRPELFSRVVAISPNYTANGTVDGWLSMFRATAAVLRTFTKLGLPTRKALMRFDLLLEDSGITPEGLTSIQTRVDILYAERDVIKESHIQEMGRLIPGATVTKVNRCTHMSILHKPEAINVMKALLLSDGSPASG